MWEYKWLYLDQGYGGGKSFLELNKLGAEGWELVAVTGGEGVTMIAFFKRRKQ